MAGRAVSLSSGMSPRVAWGHCRHSRGGPFYHLHSQVVLFINKLERVSLLPKFRQEEQQLTEKQQFQLIEGK
jgi:hypothetical protein